MRNLHMGLLAVLLGITFGLTACEYARKNPEENIVEKNATTPSDQNNANSAVAPMSNVDQPFVMIDRPEDEDSGGTTLLEQEISEEMMWWSDDLPLTDNTPMRRRAPSSRAETHGALSLETQRREIVVRGETEHEEIPSEVLNNVSGSQNTDNIGNRGEFQTTTDDSSEPKPKRHWILDLLFPRRSDSQACTKTLVCECYFTFRYWVHCEKCPPDNSPLEISMEEFYEPPLKSSIVGEGGCWSEAKRDLPIYGVPCDENGDWNLGKKSDGNDKTTADVCSHYCAKLRPVAEEQERPNLDECNATIENACRSKDCCRGIKAKPRRRNPQLPEPVSSGGDEKFQMVNPK